MCNILHIALASSSLFAGLFRDILRDGRDAASRASSLLAYNFVRIRRRLRVSLVMALASQIGRGAGNSW